MYISFKKIKLFLLITTAVMPVLILFSCKYETVELKSLLENDKNEEVTETIEIDDLSDEEFFFDLKARQKNKNPLSDINVRKAIFYAIDRERIIAGLFNDYGEVLDSLFVESSPYYSPAWSIYNYDPEKAKEYLKKAGYDTDNPLYLTISTIDSSQSKQLIEDIIKENLDQIGIKLWFYNRNAKEWYEEFVRNGDYELGLWSIYNFDGSKLYNSFHSEKLPSMESEENKNCENFYWYSNTKVDDMLQDISNTENDELKQELFVQFQDLLADEAVIFPLYNRLFTVAYNDKITNLDMDIIDNAMHLNIENWGLASLEDQNEENSQVNIGINTENFDFSNIYSPNIINSLLLKGLWEQDQNGKFNPVLVEESLEHDDEFLASLPATKIKVVIREDAKWEDGTQITSQDVKHTFEKSIIDDHFVSLYPDCVNIENIEIKSGKEFTIVFKKYFKNWESIFFTLFPEDMPENIVTSVDDIKSNGPYKVLEYVENEYLLLERNSNYFGEIAEIKYIKFIFNDDIHNLIGMLKENEIDVLNIPVDIALMEELEEAGYNLSIKPGNILEHLAVCLKPVE